MSATLTHPEVQLPTPVDVDRPLRQIQAVQVPPAENPATDGGSIVRGVILSVIGAGAVALLLFSLVPAIFVAMVVFLPVLLPFMLLGLVVVLEDDVHRARARGDEQAQQPCSCHHDRMQRALRSVSP